MQNAFVDPAGALHTDRAEELLAVLNIQIGSAARAGSPVFYTRDEQPVPTDRARSDSADWPVALHPDLRVVGEVVAKGPGVTGGFSGFVHHDAADGHSGVSLLDRLLRAASVRHLVVTGLAADVCVKETALEGARLGYAVTVPLRASRFVHAHPDGDAAAIAELTAAGVAVDTCGGG